MCGLCGLKCSHRSSPLNFGGYVVIILQAANRLRVKAPQEEKCHTRYANCACPFRAIFVL